MTLVAVIRAFAGPDWQPAEMAFTSRAPVGHMAAERFPNTRFRFGRQATWVTLPRAILSLALREDALPPHGSGAQGAPDLSTASDDFTASLKRLLQPYLRDGYPHIDLAAEIAGTSVRTLQRRLAKAGLSYSGLVQQVRFEAAKRLVIEPQMRMIDVAYTLGWSSPATFTRAFHDLAGISPTDYRAWHLSGGDRFTQ